MSCNKGQERKGSSCIVSNTMINDYVNHNLLPDISIHFKTLNENEYQFYKEHIKREYNVSYSTYEEFNDNFVKSAYPIKMAFNNDNYIVSIWRKMLLICDVLATQDTEEPILEPSNSQSEILDQLIVSKFFRTFRNIAFRTKRFQTKVNEVMSLLISNMYDIVEFNSEQNDGISMDGYDVFQDYDLQSFVQKPLFMKDQFDKIKIFSKNNSKSVQYQQYPYGEISSFKLKKDMKALDIFQGLPRNVRVSNNEFNNVEFIASKSMWYKLKKIDDVLINIEKLFNIVKTFFANSTIEFAMKLHEVYPLPDTFAAIYGNQLTDTSLEKYIRSNLVSLKETKYAPMTARLYRELSSYLDDVLFDNANRQRTDIFVNNVEQILEPFQKQNGGATTSQHIVNLGLKIGFKVKDLVKLTLININEGIRRVLDLPRWLSVVFTTLYSINRCGVIATDVLTMNFAAIPKAIPSCMVSLYLLRIATSDAENIVNVLQTHAHIILGTTDIVSMIIQFGAFQKLHNTLLQQIKFILNCNNMLDEEVKKITEILEQEIKSINENVDASTVDARYIYILYDKLFDMLVNHENTNTAGYRFIVENFPKTRKELSIVIQYLTGTMSPLYELLPSQLSLYAKREAVQFFDRNFISSDDLKEFIAICILQHMDQPMFDKHKHIYDYYISNNDTFSSINSSNSRDQTNILNPFQKFHMIDNGKYVEYDEFVSNLDLNSDNVSKYHIRKITNLISLARN
jgi:hypothetical protein